MAHGAQILKWARGDVGSHRVGMPKHELTAPPADCNGSSSNLAKFTAICRADATLVRT
jgi:hypothetical protein